MLLLSLFLTNSLAFVNVTISFREHRDCLDYVSIYALEFYDSSEQLTVLHISGGETGRNYPENLVDGIDDNKFWLDFSSTNHQDCQLSILFVMLESMPSRMMMMTAFQDTRDPTSLSISVISTTTVSTYDFPNLNPPEERQAWYDPFLLEVNATLYFEQDYHSIISNSAQEYRFLSRCSSMLQPVQCVAVYPGSTVLNIRGPKAEVNSVISQVEQNGLEILPEFPRLTILVTNAPTFAPSPSYPSISPIAPTFQPTTYAPTVGPVTSIPSASPVTSEPSSSPISSDPSSTPTFSSPSSKPSLPPTTTALPTKEPTLIPTSYPLTSLPTATPSFPPTDSPFLSCTYTLSSDCRANGCAWVSGGCHEHCSTPDFGIQNTRILDYNGLRPNSIEECETRCVSDPLCHAFEFGNNCYLYQSFERSTIIPTTDIRICFDPFVEADTSKSESSDGIFPDEIANQEEYIYVSLAGFLVFVCCCFCLCCRRNKNDMPGKNKSIELTEKRKRSSRVRHVRHKKRYDSEETIGSIEDIIFPERQAALSTSRSRRANVTPDAMLSPDPPSTLPESIFGSPPRKETTPGGVTKDHIAPPPHLSETNGYHSPSPNPTVHTVDIYPAKRFPTTRGSPDVIVLESPSKKRAPSSTTTSSGSRPSLARQEESIRSQTRQRQSVYQDQKKMIDRKTSYGGADFGELELKRLETMSIPPLPPEDHGRLLSAASLDFDEFAMQGMSPVSSPRERNNSHSSTRYSQEGGREEVFSSLTPRHSTMHTFHELLKQANELMLEMESAQDTSVENDGSDAESIYENSLEDGDIMTPFGSPRRRKSTGESMKSDITLLPPPSQAPSECNLNHKESDEFMWDSNNSPRDDLGHVPTLSAMMRGVEDLTGGSLPLGRFEPEYDEFVDDVPRKRTDHSESQI